MAAEAPSAFYNLRLSVAGQTYLAPITALPSGYRLGKICPVDQRAVAGFSLA
jgi:hypothetical protein